MTKQLCSILNACSVCSHAVFAQCPLECSDALTAYFTRLSADALRSLDQEKRKELSLCALAWHVLSSGAAYMSVRIPVGTFGMSF